MNVKEVASQESEILQKKIIMNLMIVVLEKDLMKELVAFLETLLQLSMNVRMDVKRVFVLGD